MSIKPGISFKKTIINGLVSARLVSDAVSFAHPKLSQGLGKEFICVALTTMDGQTRFICAEHLPESVKLDGHS